MTIQGRTLGQILKEKLEEENPPQTLNDIIKNTNKSMEAEEAVKVSGVPYLVPGQHIDADVVNSPEHYKAGGIETIDYIEAKATEEELRGYLKYNVIKYLSRAKYKGNDLQDLKKAQWYLNRLVSKYGEPNEN